MSSVGHCVPVFVSAPEPEPPYVVKLVQHQGAAPGSLYAMPLDLWAASQEPLQAWRGLEGRAVTLQAPYTACRARLLDLQGRTVAYLVDGALLLDLAGEWLRLELIGTAGGRKTFGGQRRVGLIAVDHRVVMEGPSEEAKPGTRVSIAIGYDASTLSYPDAPRVTMTGNLLLDVECMSGAADRSVFERLLYWLTH